MNAWQRNGSKEIDHRSEALGPAFLPTNLLGKREERWRDGICAIGPRRVAANRIVQAIEQAKETIVLSSFILSDEAIAQALLERTRRGVRVYMLLAAARAKKEPREDEDFDVRMYEAEKRLLKSLGGHVLVRTAEYFHAKVVLVDAGKGPGFLLTSNLTTEALERNEELAVELSPKERESVHQWLRFAFWELAQNDLPTPEALSDFGPKGWAEMPSPAIDVPVTVKNALSLREAAASIVDGAQKELWVASYGWSSEHPVVQQIVDRARKGLRVTALCRPRATAMKALLALREAGANVLGFPHLHAKALWNDSGDALVMSANLERRGLDEGFEMGVRLVGSRADALRAELEVFAKTATWKLDNGPRIGDALGKLKRWNGKSLEDIEVVEINEVDLGRTQATSADCLDETPKSPPAHPTKFSHFSRLRWTMEAPMLHPKAKRVQERSAGTGEASDRPHPFALYVEPSGRRVVGVRRVEEIPAAQAFGSEHGAVVIVRVP